MLTRPDPTRQNPAKSWPDPTRPDPTRPDPTRGSIRPVDNSELDPSYSHARRVRLNLTRNQEDAQYPWITSPDDAIRGYKHVQLISSK